MPGLLTLFTSNQTREEIADAHRSLHLRKKLVVARRRLVQTRTRRALASKKALAAAVAGGFVVGQLTQNRYCKDCAKGHPLKFDSRQMLRVGLKIYSLTRTVTSLSDFFTDN